jgi:phosphatidylglycerophosphate synthase
MAHEQGRRYGILLANALTTLRLAVAIGFPLVPHQWRLTLVLTGAVSDALDGFVARVLHGASWLGALLDGITDKVFTLSVLLTLTIGGPLDWLQMAGLLARDVVNASFAVYVGSIGRWDLFRRVAARASGKIATVALFVMMVVILWRPALATPLVWLAMATSVVAATDYAIIFVRWTVLKIEPMHLPAASE